MVTFFETLFLESVPFSCCAPLLQDSLALFEEHWTAANGDEVRVFAYDAVNLLGCTAAEWRADIQKAEASAAQALELQTQVAALETKLANPITKDPADAAPKASGSAYKAAQMLHNCHAN